jgi:anaerobic glycerol-3-phosphate dehydrogenase
MTATHVIVVGAGFAGMAAALRAKEQGCDVTLVSKAGGASSLWSGAIDVADEHHDAVPGATFSPLDGASRGTSITEAMRGIARRHPRHPYGQHHARLDDVAAALAFFTRETATMDWMMREDGKNHVVPTILGTWKRCAVAPRDILQDGIELAEKRAVVAVVEWRDLAGFNAAPVIAMMKHIDVGHRLTLVPVIIPRVYKHIFRDAAECARMLDGDTAFAKQMSAALFTALAEVRVKHGVTHALSPIVVPGSTHAALMGGVVVRGFLQTPPSFVAHKLKAAFAVRAAAVGIRLVDAAVTGIDASRARVQVDVEGGAGIEGDGVVLTTGSFFAGGLVRNQTASEPLLNLPVVIDGQPVRDAFIGTLTGDHVDAEHAIFRAGVTVGNDWCVDGHKSVVAAGSILSGYDPTRLGTAAGVAVWTGYSAATSLVARLAQERT